MPNGRRRLFSTFASSILLGASMLAATPAPAQTGGEGGWNNPYCCNVTGCGWGTLYGPGYGYSCCFNDGYGWYSLHAWGTDACYIYPPYQSPDQPTDRVSQGPAEPAGQ